MQPIQIVGLIVVAFGILRALISFKDHKISAKWFVFWLVIWSGVGIIAFIPSIASQISEPLGVSRGIDLLVYGSILFIFYMIFRIYLRLEALEHNITRLVREIAIRKHQNSTNSDDNEGGILNVLKNRHKKNGNDGS